MHKTINNFIDGYTLQWYNTLESSNITATNLALAKANEGTIILADFQTNGRGQRNNKWESLDSENLTFSIIFRPSFIYAEEQFILLKTLSLGVCDYLNTLKLNAKIKWPNDIYIDNNKIAGMLIEHSIIGSTLDFSIIGIGINLNQVAFSQNVPNPTSLKLETKNNYNRLEVLKDLVYCIKLRYNTLKDKDSITVIENDYFKNLYRKDGYHSYKTPENKIINAKIIGIKNTGELIIEDTIGKQYSFAFKEISFI